MRAVEVSGRAGRRSVRAVGQVGLPPGAVVDGEIKDQLVVTRAIERLWSEGGFGSKRVVVAAAGQRVIVRQADVPAMSADDFRTAMHFEVQDMIPIAVSDALLDFQILGPSAPSASGREQMRILLAAADRQTVGRLLDTVKAAGLETAGIDVAPEAQLRGAQVRAGGATVGLVAVGANLTTVSLQCATGEFFSRTLSLGAGQLTRGIGVRLGIEPNEAEAVKRYAGTDQPGAGRAAALVGSEAEPIIEQIVESLEFFWSQSGRTGADEVVLTGGGALTVGMVDGLAAAVAAPVRLLDAFEGLDLSALELAEADLGRLRPLCLTAVGLAGWESTPDGRRFSLLPPEVLAARARRRAVVRASAGVAALAVALAGVGVERHHQITSVESQADAVEAHDDALQATTASLQAVSKYVAAVSARQHALAATAAGIDWPAFYRTVSAAMPPGSTLLSISATEGTSSATTGAASAAAPTTVTMSVSANGNLTAVAGWIRTMSKVPALTALDVPSSSTTTTAGVQTTTWTATAVVTAKAPTLHHPWETK